MKKNQCLFICLFIALAYGCPIKCRGQNVYTIAGTGTYGYSGDGGPATAARLSSPKGIAFDKNCNLYFIDFANQAIRKIDVQSGVISTITSSLYQGYDLEMDANDNLYASSSNAIYKIDINSGAKTAIVTFSGGFFDYGIGIDAAGYIYMGENSQITKIDPSTFASTVVAGNGTSTHSGDGGPATSAGIGVAMDIAFDAAGNLFFTESDHVIRKINTSGIISTYAGTPGVQGFSGDGGPAASAQFNFGSGASPSLIIDPNGDLLVYDFHNRRLRKINHTTGIITTIAGNGTIGFGGDGGPLSSISFYGMNDFAFDKTGNLFFTDEITERIRMACTASSVSSVSISASPSNVVCANTPVTFTASTPGCYIDYKWYKLRGGSTTHVGNGATYTDYAPKTGDDIYCVINSSSNPINANCSSLSSQLTSNTITMVVGGVDITGVDINTRCVPGFSIPAVTPRFQISIEGGTSPVTYDWVPQSLNSVTLSNTTESNPEVTWAANEGYADFMVRVADASGCPDQFLHVQTQFTTDQTFDLSLKDSPWDLYMEPNNQADIDPNHWNIWLSPDVWNRIYADDIVDHQDAKHTTAAEPNQSYLRLRNVGCLTASSSTSKRYWTMGGMSEAWPNDWTTSVYSGPGGSKPQGSLIATGVHFNSPAVGYPGKFSYPWIPPNPADYFSGSSVMDVCFLGRIEDGHNAANAPVGMTFPEVARVSDNVRKNNNIATRNFKTVKVDHLKPGHAGLLVGSADNIHTVSIDFINQANFKPGTTSYLNQYMKMTVFLGDLFDVWVNGGALGTYASVNYTTKTVVFDGTNTMRLDNIQFEGNEQYPVEIKFEALDNVDIIQVPEEIIHFRQLYIDVFGSEQVYGNYSYQIQYDRSSDEDMIGMKQGAINIEKALERSDDILVYPNPANSAINFELKEACHSIIKLFDMSGRIIQEKESNNRNVNLKTEVYPAGMYIYQIITNNVSKTGKVVIDHNK